MFTGIIEEIGIVKSVNKAGTGALLGVKADKVIADTKIGDSISVNGSCLSVVEISGNAISFDIMPETLKKTTLGNLRAGDPVNLERSAKIDARIGGHFVTGHVDYNAGISDIIKNQAGVSFKISLPEIFSKFVVDKGSVALDGVSLTVAEVSKNYFITYLIPLTLKNTALGAKKKGDFINVETDILGKYAAKNMDKADSFQDMLKEYGYM